MLRQNFRLESIYLHNDKFKSEIIAYEILKQLIHFSINLQENLEDDDDDDDSIISDIDISSDDETSTQKLIADERGNKLALYEGLVDKTRDIPLEKVGSEVDIYFRQGFNICQFH